jgi:hypothetical protein
MSFITAYPPLPAFHLLEVKPVFIEQEQNQSILIEMQSDENQKHADGSNHS